MYKVEKSNKKAHKKAHKKGFKQVHYNLGSADIQYVNKIKRAKKAGSTTPSMYSKFDSG